MSRKMDLIKEIRRQPFLYRSEPLGLQPLSVVPIQQRRMTSSPAKAYIHGSKTLAAPHQLEIHMTRRLGVVVPSMIENLHYRRGYLAGCYSDHDVLKTLHCCLLWLIVLFRPNLDVSLLKAHHWLY